MDKVRCSLLRSCNPALPLPGQGALWVCMWVNGCVEALWHQGGKRMGCAARPSVVNPGACVSGLSPEAQRTPWWVGLLSGLCRCSGQRAGCSTSPDLVGQVGPP